MTTRKISNTADRIYPRLPNNGPFHTTVVPCTGGRGDVRFNVGISILAEVDIKVKAVR
jgi:hypothetical protein